MRRFARTLRRSVLLAAVGAVALLQAGCETVGYYGQAIRGQTGLLLAREPVDDLLADPATDAALRQRLAVARDLLDFADGELGLEVGGRYGSYVALDVRSSDGAGLGEQQ